MIYAKFGKKLVYVIVESLNEIEDIKGNYFEQPLKIKISSRLNEELLIPDSLIYQLKCNKNSLTIGPTIGLLMGNHNHLYSPQHMKKYSDRFGIYNKIGGLIYAFSPKSIDWDNKVVYGLYYNISKSEWEYGKFPLPEVVYRRNFHTDSKTIKRLINEEKVEIFNSYRYSKYELYKYLYQNKEIRNYMPYTEMCQNYNQIKKFIDENQKVVLKPNDLSRGRGICVIKKINTQYKIIDYRAKTASEVILKDNEDLENFFNNNKDFLRNYIIQKYINLAKIDKAVFDIRIVMQKIKKDLWQCTGSECRVAVKNSFITNISRGSEPMGIYQALHKAFPHSKYKTLNQQISDFCCDFCKNMDNMGEHFAEFGIDVAFDVKGKLWFIEANVFPSFKGIKKLDNLAYLSIRYTPLIYAVSLTEFNTNGIGEGEIW